MNRILKSFMVLLALCATIPSWAAVQVKGTIKDGTTRQSQARP